MVSLLLAYPALPTRFVVAAESSAAAHPAASVAQQVRAVRSKYWKAMADRDVSQTTESPGNVRKQCLVIPPFDTDLGDRPRNVATVVRTQRGEIFRRASAVYRYWTIGATRAALIEIDGTRFVDRVLWLYDEDGCSTSPTP